MRKPRFEFQVSSFELGTQARAQVTLEDDSTPADFEVQQRAASYGNLKLET